jgi:hypothetical protein
MIFKRPDKVLKKIDFTNPLTLIKVITNLQSRLTQMDFDTDTINTVMTSCDERITSMQQQFLIEPDEHENHTNNIKLVEVEKVIYQSLTKQNNSSLFPMLLRKYDDLMEMSYQIAENMVKNGVTKETTYLEFCKKSLEQRDYIKKLCMYGEHR